MKLHNNFKDIFSFLILFLSLTGSTVAAPNEFVIEDIRIEGLQRLTAGTVFNYLPLEVGDTFTEQKSLEAVRALFKSGLFEDVRLERDGNILVVIIKERPAIGSINISGNKDIKTEDIMKNLEPIGFAVGRVFDQSQLDTIEKELRRVYFSQGKYGVKINSTVTPLGNNRVAVSINLVEGKAAKIKQINIVGNKSFKERKLLKMFELKTTNLLSFFNKKDQYSRQKLSGDLEKLRSFYQDHGYVNFNIDSTQVSITPDKKDIYITINITEGDQYTVSGVKLAGDFIVPEDQLFRLITVREGALFSRKEVTDSSTRISDRLGDVGYAFANVNSIPDIDNKAKTVAITFFVDPGKRVYVRRINFSGNTRTRDEVLRREMRQQEDAWISTPKVDRGKTRLERLGYFKDDEVNVETPAVPGTSDQVDVNYTVEEKPFGNFTAGLGYSQTQGLIVQTSISQNNFLGSGKKMGFSFNNSDINRVFSVSYLNPYYTVDGISRGINMSYQETNGLNANITAFNSRMFGGGFSFGIPISETNSIFSSINYQNTKLSENGYYAQEVLNFINKNGSQYDVLRASLGFAYDSRNRAIFPDRGQLQQVVGEIAVPSIGNNLEFYKLSYRTQIFKPLFGDFVLAVKGDIGYAKGYGKTSELPFFENYYAGGPRSVRGFKENTLGPRDNYDNPLGGNIKLITGAEIQFPIPFVEAAKDSVRVQAFVDAGNVYNDSKPGYKFDIGGLRYSVGVGAIWMSPFGMVSVSYSKPFNVHGPYIDASGLAHRGDEVQRFQFNFGSQF